MKFVPNMKLIVQQAGELVLSRFRSEIEVATKFDGSIVTEIDIACERFLKKELSNLIPGSGFYTEESEAELGNDYCWIIDPIDGTKNFASGIPYFCVAVALEFQGEVVAAVTYAPALKEWFCAEQGEGMWWNDKKITLEGDYWKRRTALLVERHSDFSKTEAYEKLKAAGLSASFRYYGSAALDLGYVAAGSIDALISKSIHWWDVAGGLLMVKEACGLVVNLDEKPLGRGIQSLYAGKKELYHLLFDKNNSF